MASRQHAAATSGVGRVVREALAVGAGLGALIGAASVLASMAFPGGNKSIRPEHLSCLSVYCAESRCFGGGCSGTSLSTVCRDRYTTEACFCVCNCQCPPNH
jgi:hypothetical protein